MPLGYQITQQRKPIAINGTLHYSYKVDSDQESSKRYSYKDLINDTISIERIQLEQDSGKSLHDNHETLSLIDLNRAGMALIEIVFAPQLTSPHQAAGVVSTIQELFRHLNICNGNMEDGSLRCDVNISVASNDYPSQGSKASNRVEIKNLNSLQRIILASTYEIERQIELLQKNEAVAQETRSFDVSTGVTHKLRTKEVAMDYRYLPDPDLPPLSISADEISSIKDQLPELPKEIIQTYLSMGLDDDKIHLLMSRQSVKYFFDQVMKRAIKNLAESNIAVTNSENVLDGKDNSHRIIELSEVANTAFQWVVSELLGYLNNWNLSVESSPISVDHMSELVFMLVSRQITTSHAKMILGRLFYAWKDKNGYEGCDLVTPRKIAESLGFMNRISDSNDASTQNESLTIIQRLCKETIDDPKNLANVQKYRNGQTRLLNFFFGDVMKKTKGNYDPKLIKEILTSTLNASK